MKIENLSLAYFVSQITQTFRCLKVKVYEKGSLSITAIIISDILEPVSEKTETSGNDYANLFVETFINFA